jgi:hypothetical protein
MSYRVLLNYIFLYSVDESRVPVPEDEQVEQDTSNPFRKAVSLIIDKSIHLISNSPEGDEINGHYLPQLLKHVLGIAFKLPIVGSFMTKFFKFGDEIEVGAGVELYFKTLKADLKDKLKMRADDFIVQHIEYIEKCLTVDIGDSPQLLDLYQSSEAAPAPRGPTWLTQNKKTVSSQVVDGESQNTQGDSQEDNFRKASQEDSQEDNGKELEEPSNANLMQPKCFICGGLCESSDTCAICGCIIHDDEICSVRMSEENTAIICISCTQPEQ